jgi:hypothetical protein
MASISIGSGAAGARKPIEVRASILREQGAAMLRSGWQGFAAMHDDPEPDENAGKSRTGWCDTDLKRAIAVAEEAGLRSYRVEIAPDGTIAIIVGE